MVGMEQLQKQVNSGIHLFTHRGLYLGVVLVTVIFAACVPSSATAQEQPGFWYDPPCLNHDFTWTTNTGRTQASQFLPVTVKENDKGVKYCQNPTSPATPSPVNSKFVLPPPVKNLQVTYYTTRFRYSDPDFAEWAGAWSALNFTFQLGEEAAGRVTGVLFSMRSISPDNDDYTTMYCRAYNFIQPLSLDALFDPDNNPLQLFFDSFRGQRPGMEYEYTIRTLPLLDTSAIDGDNLVRLRYRAPSCYSIPNDYLCKQTDTRGPPPQFALCSYWRPQYFNVIADYRDLSIAMELGPDECSFDFYWLTVHRPSEAKAGSNLWGNGHTMIDIANETRFQRFDHLYDRNITYIKISLANVSTGQQVIKVTPTPTRNTCFSNDGTARPCSITLSRVVSVIENPCRSSPCSSLEVCQANGANFSCVCKPGFMRDDVLCVRNPCELLSSSTQEPYNPCGSGMCIFTNNKQSYSCNCTEGMTFVDGTCSGSPNQTATTIVAADPCIPNPCNNGTCQHQQATSTGQVDYSCNCQPGYMNLNQTCRADPCHTKPCGYHGNCRRFDQSEETLHRSGIMYSFSCDCSLGFSYDYSKRACKMSSVTIAAVITFSLLTAVLLLLVLAAWRRRESPTNILLKVVPCVRNDQGISGSQTPSVADMVDGIPVHNLKDQDQGISGSQTPSVADMVDGIPVHNLKDQDVERTEMIQPKRRVKTVLLHSQDHPLHEEVVKLLTVFLTKHCGCDVALPEWCAADIRRRGLSEWITDVVDRADKVILLCSKGSSVGWHSHASLPGSPTDIFTRAMSIILRDNASIGLSSKYCVAYMDYSSRSDVPALLAGGAVYCLMEHMDLLYFRLHDMRQESPNSRRRALELEDENYAGMSLHGTTLHEAIGQMRALMREERNCDTDCMNGLQEDITDTSSQGPLINDPNSDDDDFDRQLEVLKMTSKV